MANRTVKDAKTIKGSNPQHLIEKIIRTRIYDSQYWKEKCFALTDEAMALDHVGGVFGGNIKPTPFLCLILKMLQIQPTKDIVIEFIKNPDYKYVRALGALYLRIIGTAVESYKYLEPLYNDYRKIKFKNRQGKFELTFVDEFIDKLLREDRVCDVILPRIQKRHILEETEQLGPRISALDEDLEVDASEDEEDADEPPDNRDKSHPRSRSRSESRSPVHRSHSPRKSRSSSPVHHRKRKRKSRSRSPLHRHHDEHHRKRTPSPSHHRHRRRSYSPNKSEKRKDKRKDKDREKSRKKDKKQDKEREKDNEKERPKEKSKDKEKEAGKHKEKKSNKSKKKDMTAEEEEEIKQANELRAKLGLKPLKL